MLCPKRKLICTITVCIALVLSGLATTHATPSLSLSWYKNNGYGMGDDIGGEWTINTQVSQEVVRVEFYLDETLQKNDTSAPFSWNFNTANFTQDNHSCKVVAYDPSGGSAVAVSEREFVEYSFGSVIVAILLVSVVFFVALLLVSWFWIKKKATQKSDSKRQASKNFLYLIS